MVLVLLAWFFHLCFLGLALSPAYGPFLIGEDAEDVQPMLWNFVVFCLNHWWIVLISLAYIGSCSLLLSHLIFGPMRRFENVLVQKRENPTEPVRCNLRRADYFHKFSKLLEEVLNGLDAMEGPAQIGQGKGAGAEKPDPIGSKST